MLELESRLSNYPNLKYYTFLNVNCFQRKNMVNSKCTCEVAYSIQH